MSQTPTIYRINTNHRLLNNKSSKDIIQVIINQYDDKSNFDLKSLKETVKDNIKYYLYVYDSSESESEWKDFLPITLTLNLSFIEQKVSLLLFIEADINLYCVVGGSSYKVVVPFIDHSFGLNTYSRIIKPELDELSSIKSRGITGFRAGMSEQFRDNYKLINYIKFGKVPQVINVRLCEETTDLYFSFLKTKLNERILIKVGKSFLIKKKVSFADLHRIIKELEVIMEIEPIDFLSSYKEISDSSIIDNTYKEKLITELFNDTQFLTRGSSDSINRFQFDFCNPNNIDLFYEAEEYKLREKTPEGGYKVFAIVNDRREIYETVLRRATELHGMSNRFMFKAFLLGVRVGCYQNNKQTISSGFLYHISTEFLIEEKPIFLIDTKWYHLRDSFINDLKVNTVHVLNTYKAPDNILAKVWDKTKTRTEKSYNQLYNGIANYIVIDTVIIDGVELCDILHYTNDTVYLIHVKYGFNASMRELTNQISISARRLREVLASNNKDFLIKIYSILSNKEEIELGGLSQEDFLNLFNKRIIYVLAFASQLGSDLKVLDNIDKYNSNIARHSLIQCSAQMRAEYYDLLNCQIMKS